MPNVKIGDNVIIDKAIVGDSVKIKKDSIIGDGSEIEVVASERGRKEELLDVI